MTSEARGRRPGRSSISALLNPGIGGLSSALERLSAVEGRPCRSRRATTCSPLTFSAWP
jgi:hypothetical protein